MRFSIEVPALVDFIIQELEKYGHEAYMISGKIQQIQKQFIMQVDASDLI